MCIRDSFHIRRYSLQVCKDKFFQYAFADIMRSAEPVSYTHLGKGAGYDRWAAVHNLKQMAATVAAYGLSLIHI